MTESSVQEKSPQLKWSIDNIQITFDSHWWGFQLHLNEDATQLLEQIDNWAGKLVNALGTEIKPIAKAIQLYLKLRNVIIKAEDRGRGVKLVSPWIMPTLLIPLPEDEHHVDDFQLRWTVYDPREDRWSDENKMQQVFSETSPALAVFRDQLFCVARGAEDNHLWWLTFDGQDWTSERKIEGVQSACRPGVMFYRHPKGTRDQLLCMHRGIKY